MKNIDLRKQALGIRRYIKYIRKMVIVVQLHDHFSDNEAFYYKAMLNSLEEYAKTHKLYMNYLLGKIQYDTVKNMLGESDRQCFRYMQRQRQLLIVYIEQKEVENFARYPFSQKTIHGETHQETLTK